MEVAAQRHTRVSIFDSLGTFFSDESVGNTLKLPFAWLWELARAESGYVTVTVKMLGATFGSDSRTARGWIDGLEALGHVEVIDRDRRSGAIRILVHDPSDTVRQRTLRADPQAVLPGLEEPDEPAESPPSPPRILSIGAGEFAQQPPREPVGAGVSAQIPPREPDGAGVSAQISPREPDAVHREAIRAWGRALLTRNGPNTNTKETISVLPNYQTKEPKDSPSAQSGAAPVGDVVPEALEAALAKYADPGRAYAKLRATILEACPEMDAPGQWAADTMARLVVCGIPPLPPIPEAEVLVDLAQLEIMRKSGERLDTPAGLLCHRFEKTANRHRYEWCPNGRIHQRE